MCLKCAYFFENPEMARKWRFCYIADNQYNPLIADWLLFARFSTNEVSSAPHKKRAVHKTALFYAVRTRLENQLGHPLQTLAGMLSIAYLCG